MSLRQRTLNPQFHWGHHCPKQSHLNHVQVSRRRVKNPLEVCPIISSSTPAPQPSSSDSFSAACWFCLTRMEAVGKGPSWLQTAISPPLPSALTPVPGLSATKCMLHKTHGTVCITNAYLAVAHNFGLFKILHAFWMMNHWHGEPQLPRVTPCTIFAQGLIDGMMLLVQTAYVEFQSMAVAQKRQLASNWCQRCISTRWSALPKLLTTHWQLATENPPFYSEGTGI